MMRKVHTRSGNRQHFYHQNEVNSPQSITNDIIRPPTSHPYSGYKSKKSQSQMRSKYCPNFFLQSKLQTNLRQYKNINQQCTYIDKLPQPFKLAINQIRVLIKNSSFNSINSNSNVTPNTSPHSNILMNSLNYKSQNHKMNESQELIQNLTKLILDILKQKNQLLRKKTQNQKTIENLNSKIFDLQKKLYQTDSTNQRQNKRLTKRNENPTKKQQQLLLQNCRLGQLNTKYLCIISQLQNRKIQKSIATPSYKQNQTKIDTQLIKCKRRISYLQTKLNSAEKVQNQLQFNNDKLEDQLKIIKQKMDTIEKQFVQNYEKMNQWRQRALMQKQDGEIHIARQQYLLYSLKKLKQNNKNLLNKILNVCKSDDKIQRKDFVQNTNFQYQLDFFKSIRGVYQKAKGQKMFTHSQVRKNQLGIQIQQVSLQTDYKNYKNSDNFDVSTLRFFRPSFFSFLEESVNQQILQSRTKSNSVPRVFIQVLRSIMLSKLNQFMYSQSQEKYTRFPQFVYAWFQKFYFNTQKNQVCALQPFMQKPINQQIFYRDLMNVKLDQSWQIITFRQFILQELSLEQLYFYLMCQMLLYSRAGITKQIQYTGDFCILVEYGAAKSVLDITLNDFQSWNITFLTSKLRQKIILKKNKEFIQAGFFLRCLLEYYKIQRCNRYRYISKLCSQFKDSKKGLRFSSFMSVINKFTQVSMDTKLKIYRDCYCLTRGVITPQSIFIVCSQQMVFLKYLKMKSFYRVPKIIHKPSKISTSMVQQNPNNPSQSSQVQQIKPNKNLLCLQPPDPYLYDIILNFTKVVNSQNNVMKRLQSFGVNEFMQQINTLVRALDQRNSQLGSNILKCKHFLHYFSNSVDIIRRLLQQQVKKKSNNFWIQFNDQDLGNIFAEQIQATFNTYSKINQLKVWKDNIYNFRLNNAAKKIQKQVRKKFIEPYLQIYKYFKQEVIQVKEQCFRQGKK